MDYLKNLILAILINAGSASCILAGGSWAWNCDGSNIIFRSYNSNDTNEVFRVAAEERTVKSDDAAYMDCATSSCWIKRMGYRAGNRVLVNNGETRWFWAGKGRMEPQHYCYGRSVEQLTYDSYTGSVKDDERYYLSNSYLGDDVVMTIGYYYRIKMAKKNPDNNDARQHWYLQKTPQGTYFIWNYNQGTDKRLDSNKNHPVMAKIGKYSGQSWVMTEDGSHAGWFKLHNSYTGPDKVIDVSPKGENYLSLEDRSKRTSGTLWKMRKVPPFEY